MEAPRSFSSSGETDLTVPCVPTGMKQGVRMTPEGVVNVPARAAPSVASRVKENMGEECNQPPSTAGGLRISGCARWHGVVCRVVPIKRAEPASGHGVHNVHVGFH